VIRIGLRLPSTALPAAGPRDPLDRAVRVGLLSLTVLLLLTLPPRQNPEVFYLVSAGIAYSIAVLSLVVLVGLVGQFSLAQAGFMGVGAFAAAHLVTDAHVPFLLAVPLGGLAAVPVGMLAAIPALRVRGVLLAVVTLSFGQALDTLFFQAKSNGGGLGGVALARPGVLASDVHYYWFELAVLGALCAFVCMFRTRKTGRVLAAVRESEPAALAVGINLVRAKVAAFGLSAFIAGVAGVVYAGINQSAAAGDYTAFKSIGLLAVAVIGGLGSAAGAVIGGLLNTLAPYYIARLPLVGSGDLTGVVFGAGLVLQMVVAPQGIASQLLEAERMLALQLRLRWQNQSRPLEALG
jgi:ABC-type branched-subunit amino acid transport system permease subunit